MKSMKIKGILFDAGGVLITINYAFLADILVDLVRENPEYTAKYPVLPMADDFEYGEHMARPQLDDIVAKKSSELSSTRLLFMGLIWNEAFKKAQQEPAPSTDGDLFKNWARTIEERHIAENLWQRVIPHTYEGLKRLKSLGITMGVVSNADGRVEEILQKNDLRQFFSMVMDSHYEKVEKPDPEIFRRALQKLNLNASETLYLGDFYSIDVIGARKAGLGAVLMDPLGVWNRKDVPIVRSLDDYFSWLENFDHTTQPSPWGTVGS